jgi:hypothetical protein
MQTLDVPLKPEEASEWRQFLFNPLRRAMPQAILLTVAVPEAP